MMRRAPYDVVVVATPMTIPYVPFSIKGAHWFMGRAMVEMMKRSGSAKERIEGPCAMDVDSCEVSIRKPVWSYVESLGGDGRGVARNFWTNDAGQNPCSVSVAP